MVKNLRQSKGITLIALVITIIVLLILAGVAIAMLTGENGIINQTNSAKTETKNAEEDEERKLNSYEETINSFVGNKQLEVPESLFKYIMGSTGTGRNLGADSIVEIDYSTGKVTFKPENGTISTTENLPTFTGFAMIHDESASQTKQFIKYENGLYEVIVDSSMNTYGIIARYVAQGNEGKKVVFESDGNSETTEYWTVITDRNNKLEIVSNEALGNLSLGKNDSSITENEDLDKNGTPGENKDKAIASYNKVIETMNNYCKSEEVIKTTNFENVRSIGAEKDKSTTVVIEGITTKESDTYYEEDLYKLIYCGIVNVGKEYWLASRNISKGSDYYLFGINYIKSSGEFENNVVLWSIKAANQDDKNFAVRPVVINPTNIQYVD